MIFPGVSPLSPVVTGVEAFPTWLCVTWVSLDDGMMGVEMTPLKKNACEYGYILYIYIYILRDPGSPCQMMIRVSGVQSISGPLFLKVDLPKEGLNSKQNKGHQRVYTYNLLSIKRI